MGQKISSVFVGTGVKFLHSLILSIFCVYQYNLSHLNVFQKARQVAAEEKRKAQREQAFIPPVEEKPKKETKKKGEIFCDIHSVVSRPSVIYYQLFPDGCAYHIITVTCII